MKAMGRNGAACVLVRDSLPLEQRSKLWTERGGRVVLSDWRIRLRPLGGYASATEPAAWPGTSASEREPGGRS